MTGTQIKNKVMEQIAETDDKKILSVIQDILDIGSSKEIYKLSDIEKAVLKKISQSKKKTLSEKEFFKATSKWLGKK